MAVTQPDCLSILLPGRLGREGLQANDREANGRWSLAIGSFTVVLELFVKRDEEGKFRGSVELLLPPDCRPESSSIAFQYNYKSNTFSHTFTGDAVSIYQHLTNLLIQLEHFPLTPVLLPSNLPADPKSIPFTFPMTKLTLDEFLSTQPANLHPYFYKTLYPEYRPDPNQLRFYGKRWFEATVAVFDWLRNLRDRGLEFEQVPLEFIYDIEKCGVKLIPVEPGFASKLGNPFRLKPREKLTAMEMFNQKYCRVLQRSLCKQTATPLLQGAPAAPALLPSQDYLPPTSFQPLDYTQGQLLGQGGFGLVYLSTYQGHSVALKVMHSARTEKDYHLDNFVREYKVMKAITHPNIVKVYGFTCFNEKSWALVVEYCPKKYTEASKEERIRMLPEIAAGVSYMHAKSLVNLDIKPHNVLISAENTPKLIDFGLSRRISESGEMGKTGFTLSYTSLEQLRSTRIGLPSDVWAFANLVYYAYTGLRPYDDMDLETLDAHSYAARKSLVEKLEVEKRRPCCEEIPARVCDLLWECWAEEPERRPTMTQVRRQLKRLSS